MGLTPRKASVIVSQILLECRKHPNRFIALDPFCGARRFVLWQEHEDTLRGAASNETDRWLIYCYSFS